METKKVSNRLLSLDVLRGITIMGMILVNNAGACGFCYEPFHHVKWNGFNPADLVFPMFMFVMGISIYLSLSKTDFDWHQSIVKVVKRTLLLFAVGIVLKWVLNSIESGNWLDFANMRIMGVLQRLAICYGVVALMSLFVPHRRLSLIALFLLAFYLGLQLIGNGFEKSATNIVAIVDNAVLGTNHIYLQGKQFVDPEGLLSTIPAVAQVMIGFLCGEMIMRYKDEERMIKIFVSGTIMLVMGFLISYVCPLNKRLWSPSFVLLTCGISSLLFALLIYIIDDKSFKSWSKPFKIVGVNPLALYVLSEVLGDIFRKLNVTTWSFTNFLKPLFGNYAGSLFYAVIFTALIWCVGLLLYRKQIFIKL